MDIRYSVEKLPTLAKFLACDAFVRVCVGPFGSGKSSACVVEILKRALAQQPGPDGIRRTRWAIIRNTYRELEDTARKTFCDWIPPTVGRWYESDFLFELKTGDVDCEVLFRALDRPEHIAKLLSLELTGAYINECREIPKHVFDTLTGRVGRYPPKKDGGPTWFGIWADTNPWHVAHWGYKLFTEQKPDDYELFEQPDGLSEAAENVDNLPPNYYQRLCLGKDSEWVDCYVHGKYPRSEVGSYFGALLAELQQRGGLEAFDHGTDSVITHWDLGHGDSTAIWFWRFNEHRMPDFVDHYEANGEPMSHYFDLLEKWRLERGYKYLKHWLPHDARQQSLQTGQSILEQCIAHWGPSMVAILPPMSIEDGIQATRWLLEQPHVRIHPRCSQRNSPKDTDGIECLREYRKQWDEVNRCFKNKPVHDWASHTADAFRYAAIVVKYAEQLTRPPPPKVDKPAAVPMNYSFTLDQLFELEKRNRSQRI